MKCKRVLRNVSDGFCDVVVYPDTASSGSQPLGCGYVRQRTVVVIESLDPERFYTANRWFCHEYEQSAGKLLPWDLQRISGYGSRDEAVGKFDWRVSQTDGIK